MVKKVYKQRISVSELTRNVHDPFEYYKDLFERNAKLAMYVNHLYWIPVLDKHRKTIAIEFVAEGTAK